MCGAATNRLEWSWQTTLAQTDIIRFVTSVCGAVTLLYGTQKQLTSCLAKSRLFKLTALKLHKAPDSPLKAPKTRTSELID